MIKIGICDDEKIQIEAMKSYVSHWATSRQKQCLIETYDHADQLWFHYQDEKDLDIVLLDIQMPGCNGIELARKLRKEQEQMVIIFITGVVDYIFEGFDVDALNYLLKPIREEQLNHCLDKALEQLEKKETYLCIQVDKVIQRIPIRKIKYIESIGHYLDVYCEDETYHIKKNLSSLEEEIQSTMFYKPHRSFLVNVGYVERITKQDVILTCGTHIPIARGKWNDVNQAFIQYHMSGRL